METTFKPAFVCPVCGGTILYERKAGPIVTRVVYGINWLFYDTICDAYWIDEGAKKWWVCGCGWKLPATTERELVEWLFARKAERE